MQKNSRSGETDGMGNGDMLAEVLEILREEKELPQISGNAGQRMLFAAVIQVFKKVEGIESEVEEVKQNVGKKEDQVLAQSNREVTKGRMDILEHKVDLLIQHRDERDRKIDDLGKRKWDFWQAVVLIVISVVINFIVHVWIAGPTP